MCASTGSESLCIHTNATWRVQVLPTHPDAVQTDHTKNPALPPKVDDSRCQRALANTGYIPQSD